MLFPTILCGGSGARLWPLSRAQFPKQLASIHGSESLFQQTVRRCLDLDGAGSLITVCNEEHRFLIAQQLQRAGAQDASILLEPAPRDTAAAIAIAALQAQDVAERDDPIVAALPSDHLIKEPAQLAERVARAVELAEQGSLAVFGIRPDTAHTGYGYIRSGERVDDGVFVAAEFTEKPNRDVASRYLQNGDYYWNAGIFVARADLLLSELERHEPQIMAHVRESFRARRVDLDFVRVDAEAFRATPARSFDYAVMERTNRALLLPVECGWSDLGTWDAVKAAGVADQYGNVIDGDVILEGCRNSYVRSQNRLAAAIGLDDMLVVDTPDALLVAAASEAQSVRAIVDQLVASGRHEAIHHRKVYRPWGSYETIALGDRFQVKRIVVDAGEAISLQLHHHRSEHWIVVRGTAVVTRNDEKFHLTENESTFIPLGAKHRLENPGRLPVEIVEVQSGSYLGEDDIVRFEDGYGRS